MTFTYTRTIRFQDTDAAGVVYFANVLSICHEAYEESLAASGVNIQAFFSKSSVAMPIVHASADFFRPMFCGDKILIDLTPKYMGDDYFEVTYKMVDAGDREVAKVLTEHVCIDPKSRKRQQLPSEIVQWFQQWLN
ncbi:acyl-CoA thioesterase [Chroococcidiopsis sp. FACHB-1243]|uniref:acyl-CoA thioesterase n=1 Tax=Chroococcidiopsis sp. [FACHB-1243] TaxID=2692781 RepID=UPI0017824DA1|nr:thioesterase family protein [Chroococcidiopsis sp. [FACHB-1243]]MBD2307690.1 acyl-CoA thioesterase [Chroococcidiopsis sp. [FACHB-1243]]